MLLTGAGALGAVLAHDEATPASSLAAAQPGQRVEVKGTPETFYPSPPLREWREILPLLGNYTYALESGPVVAVLTGDLRAPEGPALADGQVVWAGDHPDRDGRVLVVIQVTTWRQPLIR
jgi:hypothetical protein